MATTTSINAEDYMTWSVAVSKHAAKQYRVDVEEAISIGYEKLVEAAQRFDVSKYNSKTASLRTNFKAFARKYIVGGIINWCRTSKFVKRRGYEAGVRFSMVYIDAPQFDTEGKPMTHPLAGHVTWDYDEYWDFRNAMDRLPTRERQVIAALSVGVLASEIALAMKISHARVDQLARRARDKMEVYMRA